MQSKDAAKNSAPATAELLQLVSFFLGNEEFALEILKVQEIIRMVDLTRVPNAPEFVEGVINLRGIIIPVVDLRKRFGLTEIRNNPRKMRMIIIRGALHGTGGPQKPLALVVDSVREVLHIPLRQIEPAPAAATGEQAGFIGGVAKAMDRLIIIIDITRILSGEELTALAEAGNVHP
jgi:purine-binding chemotaxis protein CheW